MAITIRGNNDFRRPWTEFVVVLFICAAATAAYAVYAGQDRNWDQRNYHIYSVYAWLTGRIFIDLEPAQIQTWLNPAAHLPQYFLVQHARPVVAGAIMGAIAGLNGLLLWILVRRLQKNDSGGLARSCAGLVLILGLSGSLFLSFLGTTFTEYLCSPFVLASLVCLTAGDQADIGARRFFLAGFWLGAVCGLKLTNLIYALGMSATLVVLWPFLRFRFVEMASYAVGGIAGFLLVGGYWATKLWLAFGNPMFPFFNGLFGSPWFETVSFTDPRFLPPSFLKALVTYPFAWLLGVHPTSELFFREPRFAYVAALLPLAVVVALLRSAERRPAGNGPDTAAGVRNFWLHAVFFVLSFSIWLTQFGIQRYALPLELLTGVIVLLSLERVLRNRRETIAVLALLVLFAVVWTRPPDWERMPYGNDWFGVESVQHSSPPILYVMMSWRPMAYAIPFLPKEDRFVRLGGNMPLEPGMPLGQRAMAIIRAHPGPIMTMTLEPLEEAERARLQRFGLLLRDDSCTSFRSRLDTFLTCGVTRAQTPTGAQ
jgi:hypothetical protein